MINISSRTMPTDRLPMPGTEQYMHFFIGENRMCFPEEEFILHMDFPRCLIRYNIGESMHVDYDEFYQSVARVEWIDGERPSPEEQQRVLTDAWNFLALDERLLEEFDPDEEEDFDPDDYEEEDDPDE